MTAPGHPRGSTVAGRLARLGFTDAPRAAQLLGPGGLGLYDGTGETDAGADAVLASLSDAADPDLALLSLCRLTHASERPRELLGDLRTSAGLRARLLGVVGASVAFGDHLARHPADADVLLDDGLTAVRPSALGLRCTLLEAVGAGSNAGTAAGPGGSPGGTPGAEDVPTTARRARSGGVDALDALRRAYRRCLLGLAARDLSGNVAVDDVAAELADLAAATLDAALAVAAAGLPAHAEPCRLAVIGMGKCGGRELNYASDVDVVFVAEPLAGGDEPAALETGAALAAGLMRATSTTTGEGTIWPVDAALRPEGKAGPLVRTLASHEAYYKRWARTWEFQALLKARPVAGDLALGRAYVDRLAPLVWTAGERPNFVDDVQAMRRRVEDTLPRQDARREVKLGPGGLRDVEFAVQLLQLVHGRADGTLRSGSTLVALDALAAGGYVGRADARRLEASYRFLRLVEHRLQLQRLRRTHRVPTDLAGVRWLARALGYRAGADGGPEMSFEADLAGHSHEVRRLHEKLFYRPLLHTVARLPATDARVDSRLSPEAARRRLEALGFRDPAGALRHLEALTAGVSRRAAIQRTLLPAMLGWFAAAADPDAGLLAFRQVSEALGSTPWYLRLLRDEGAVAERFAHVLASSRFVADLIGRAPEAVNLLAGDGELTPRPREQLAAHLLSVVRRQRDAEAAVIAARGVRRHELLRVASADVLGQLDVCAVGAALSDITAATIAAAVDTAQRTVEADLQRPLPARLTVIAMGRLGGREQGYGSDADVLFVHEAHEGVRDDEAAAAASAVAEEARRLLAGPAPDPPLRVDADLRPEGRAGPLTRSLASYAAYYGRWSSGWEAQALLRAEPVAGDRPLGEAFLSLIGPVRWPPSGPPPEAVVEIRRLKSRIEAERLPRGADPATHTKLGRGGLADVEWTVQLCQLQHAATVPGLRTTGTLEALAAAVDAGLVAPGDATVLETAWRLATRARNAIVLVAGRPADALPPPGRVLEGVARVLGYPAGPGASSAGTAFLEDYRRATRRARAVVERAFYA